MKHTLLASTAIVALTGAAAAEITISGTARLGLVTTEGAAKVAQGAYGKIDNAMEASLDQFGIASGTADEMLLDRYNLNIALTFTDGTATAGDVTNIKTLIANAQNLLDGGQATGTATDWAVNAKLADSTAERTQIQKDIDMMNSVLTAITPSAAVAKQADTTVGKNRVRIKFAGSGETDGGLSYGFSVRADNSNSADSGSQYISGAFGKISMGDLNGGDEQLVGNLSGVGSSGAGSSQEFAYQSSSHNIGYSVSMAGVSFAATTDLKRGADPALTGSNSAMGIKWAGDMGGGANVAVALGQSKIGLKTENSVSAKVSMGGLTITAVSHTNDNGPAVAATAATTQTFGASGAQYKAAVAKVDNLDTDTTGLSISYAMDAMSVTAYTRTESTSGVLDKDYSGVGFTYNLGGGTIKAGFVDANDISVMDFGINFSF
jgi:outer membrane protein OmpU